jgi:hypothetical protein
MRDIRLERKRLACRRRASGVTVSHLQVLLVFLFFSLTEYLWHLALYGAKRERNHHQTNLFAAATNE